MAAEQSARVEVQSYTPKTGARLNAARCVLHVERSRQDRLASTTIGSRQLLNKAVELTIACDWHADAVVTGLRHRLDRAGAPVRVLAYAV